MATRNLGNVRALISSSVEPTNKNVIWQDTSAIPYVKKAWNNNLLIWEALSSESTGEANTSSNVGTGAGIYKEKVGVDLRLKSLKSGTNITISEQTDEIVINASGKHTIEDEGSTVTQANILNFLGFKITYDSGEGKIIINKGETSNTIVNDLDELIAIEGYQDDNSVFVISELAWYKFYSNEDNGEKPSDGGDGSWIKYINLTGNLVDIKYGALYNYAAIIDTKKITSSDDWIIPTKTDWATLKTTINDSGNEGYHLKSIRFTPTYNHPRWNNSTYAGIDTYNFRAIPAGYISDQGEASNDVGDYFTAWASDAETQNKVVAYFTQTTLLYYSITGSDYTTEGHSVRLMRTATSEEQSSLSNGDYADNYIGNDGVIYKTIKMGTQIWLAEALCETKFRDGTSITKVTNSTDWFLDSNSKYASPAYNDSYNYNTISGIIVHNDLIGRNTANAHPGTAILLADNRTVEEAVNKVITSSQTWDGTSHSIDLSNEEYDTLVINDTVESIILALSFASDSDSVYRKKVILIDNSSNTSAISTITFDDNSGVYTWNWSDGDPVTGIAIGAKVRLEVENISDTEVFATTIPIT